MAAFGTKNVHSGLMLFSLTFMRKLRTLLRTNKVAYVLGRTRRKEVVSLQLFVYITIFPAKPGSGQQALKMQG